MLLIQSLRRPARSRRTSVACWLVTAGCLLALPPLIGEEALAGFGGPIVEPGRFGLGMVGHRYTRDIYDVEHDQLSNPNDTFGYVALEARMGIWRERVDFSLQVGRAHHAENEHPDRDLMTYEMGFTLRGLVWESADERLFLLSGLHYRDTMGFDRQPSPTHKVRRHLLAFGYFGRPIVVATRPARIYGGLQYSRHQLFDYNDEIYQRPWQGPGEGETRDNVLLTVGMTVRAHPRLELAGELDYRSSLSFGFSGLIFF